ncbi:hypothetical protein ACFOZ5_05760 [Marinobacter lacisalsi]|uniref:Uncharacterized protein n=1 Tax=Marinobacter lacisalsi TaxID=475979 RepID=A0ABV8QDW5_9GAMM
MIVSGYSKHIYGNTRSEHRRSDQAEKIAGSHAPGDSIPARYRDQCGGIDLEQVQRDQKEARRQLVRAMLQSLRNVVGWR